ncbi:hypothetical protein CLOM_g584, partial [Closterium sp. NIES-68]
LTVVQGLIKRNVVYIKQRYVECGSNFGGGNLPLLTAFIEAHRTSRAVTIEGCKSDGTSIVHKFDMHDERPGEDHDECSSICMIFSKVTEQNIVEQLGDLEKLNGCILFTLEAWPPGRKERNSQCMDWL